MDWFVILSIDLLRNDVPTRIHTSLVYTEIAQKKIWAHRLFVPLS